MVPVQPGDLMMRAHLIAIGLLALTAPSAAAQDGAGDVVRLPGSGEVKAPPRPGEARERLVPGGGLFLSFDSDRDGVVTQAEVDAGVRAAFAEADANGDGELTALEQQAWATSLPTRDDSLANPVRFDPNLDRIVSAEEFRSVVQELAASFADEASGYVVLAALRAPDPPRERAERARPDALQP